MIWILIMQFLTFNELKYLYETVELKITPYIHMYKPKGIQKTVLNSIMNNNTFPVSSFAPLSFQIIILFVALDTLNSRVRVKKEKKKFNSVDFSKISSALPTNNDTETIYKFCYLLMLELRNKYTHEYPEENIVNIQTNQFEISKQGIDYLFSLVLLYICLYSGVELNKYDSEVLKQYVHIVYNELKFFKTQQKDNPFEKKISFLFKDEKLKLDNNFKTFEYRWRNLVYPKNLEELLQLKRLPNFQQKNMYNDIVLNTHERDEYLIVFNDKKYLVLGVYLENTLQDMQKLSEWELKENWIGKQEYETCYKNESEKPCPKEPTLNPS